VTSRRELDIVVLGATGFTGALTGEYLAAHAPAATRSAVAGRNRGKLEALRNRLGVDVQIFGADISDQVSLRRLAEASRVVVTTVGPVPPGGTVGSAVASFSRFRQAAAAHAERRRTERRDDTRRARAVSGRPGYDRDVGAWVLQLPTIDPQIVVRSAQALDRYGPDFSYSHFVALRNPIVAAVLTAGVAGTFALAQLPPTRKLLLGLRPSGAGPTAEQRKSGWFRFRVLQSYQCPEPRGGRQPCTR
jgi:Saccharopine dehydrogenase NADP binding domain